MKIQRLNMDNSWFIKFGGLKILVDPWLMGTEIDFFSWFNTQWHRTAPIPLDNVPDFDVVLITQKYPDHFHLETLKRLRPSMLIGPQSLASKVDKHFPKAEFLAFNQGLSKLLGSKLAIHHLPSARRIDPIYDAIILEDGKQSICIASHGYPDIANQKKLWENLPPVQLLISPFDHYQLPLFLGGTVAPGIDGLRLLAKTLRPTKIIATHDEDKHAKGLVSKFAKITKAPKISELEQYEELEGRLFELNNYQALEL